MKQYQFILLHDTPIFSAGDLFDTWIMVSLPSTLRSDLEKGLTYLEVVC